MIDDANKNGSEDVKNVPKDLNFTWREWDLAAAKSVAAVEWKSTYGRRTGRFVDAVELCKKMEELAPTSPVIGDRLLNRLGRFMKREGWVRYQQAGWGSSATRSSARNGSPSGRKWLYFKGEVRKWSEG